MVPAVVVDVVCFSVQLVNPSCKVGYLLLISLPLALQAIDLILLVVQVVLQGRGFGSQGGHLSKGRKIRFARNSNSSSSTTSSKSSSSSSSSSSNNDDNNVVERRNMRFLIISSLHRELSPTRTLM